MSNTEQMVSVPRDEVERLVKLLQYQAHPYPSPHAEFWQGLLDAPAAQHQGEQVEPYSVIAQKLVQRLNEEFVDPNTLLTVQCIGDLIAEYLHEAK